MKTSIELNDEACADAGQILNLNLADEYVLHTAMWICHRNLPASEPVEVRFLLEDQCAQVSHWIDLIAERGRRLAITRRGTWVEVTKPARFSDLPPLRLSFRQMLAEVLVLHDEIIAQLQVDSEECIVRFKDSGTAEFLTGLLVKHAEAAGELRLQLEAKMCRQAVPIKHFQIPPHVSHE